MILDAQCYRWTATGMVATADATGAYISVREVERLLEKAHEIGFERAEAIALRTIREFRADKA